MMADSDRIEQLHQIVRQFLEQRDASGPSIGQLTEQHPHLMPELEQWLEQADRLLPGDDAERKAAQADVDTLAFERKPEEFSSIAARALNVRCPYCFTNILVGADQDLLAIACDTCKSQFGLADDAERKGTWQVGRFEIIAHLGAGSVGTVWKARDVELDRFVAIKIPRQGKLEPREVQQFVHEARVAAKLNHPGIVEVLEVGRDEDSVYIVSDFIDGMTLSERVKKQGLSCREAAELCVKIADALEHAHNAGVIHRDLKPANIIISRDGKPFVTDFGLAKHHIGEVTITADGHILGTPAYMSPEQARGEAGKSDRRSDIYALGTILFELLTGERPFRGDITRLMQQVVASEPPRPRDLRRTVPRDLETICLKCLEKDPDRRYATAKKLGDDLQRWLSDLPILARPIGNLERTRRWCTKYPLLSALVTTACLTLLLALAAAWSVKTSYEKGQAVALQELTLYSQRDSPEIKDLRSIVQRVANDVIDARLDLSNQLELERFVQSLYERMARDPAFASHQFKSWYLLDTSGRMLAVWPTGRDVRGRDFRDRDYFRGALAAPGRVYASKAFRSENDGLCKFALSIALLDDGGDTGVVLAGSVATDTTRAIAREEQLLNDMVFWIGVVLTPTALLAGGSLVSLIYLRVR